MKKRPYISFAAFYAIKAQLRGWDVPEIHYRICHFMEHRGRKGVLKVFRGAAKSTIVAAYEAWVLRNDPTWLFINRSADDATATKLSADTAANILQHPLCRGMIKGKAGVERFSVEGNPEAARNASCTAYGILSNATSSRANEIINDDTEVPKNIETPMLRQKLRDKLQEEVHILIPGGKILYIGTDHTVDSIYDEKIKAGYESLIIPLFSQSVRHEADGKGRIFEFHFPVTDPLDFYVMINIGQAARVLETGEYELARTETGGMVKLHETLQEGNIIDLATGNAWPSRFDRAEIKFKREECNTFNAWDSQYMLKARPVHNIRLNPDRLIVYEEQPEIVVANNALSMYLNGVQLTGCRAYWDPSKGKADSDDSTFSVMFQDDRGHLYWHILEVQKGEVFEQCDGIIPLVRQYQLPSVMIETNGIGGFLPPILRKALKEARLQCGVTEVNRSQNKTAYILDAYEVPLSGQFLHVHRSVLESGLAQQMNSWIPSRQAQQDDLIDSGAGCIRNLPVKIGKVVHAALPQARNEWRPNMEQYEVEVEY